MKFFRQIIAITGLLMLLIAPVRAFDGAILKGIEIDSPDSHGYRIIIKTTKDVPIKKYITAANKVVLDLENIQPAQYVNTLYNNATEIDHVIVQPFPGNKLRIFLQGLNIAAGKIILDTRDEALSFMTKNEEEIETINEPVIQIQEQSPIIQMPVRMTTPTPAPVSKPTREVSSDQIFIDLSDKTVDKVKSVSPIVSYNNNETGKDNLKMDTTSLFDWALRIIMLVVIIIAGFKFFSKPKVEIKLSSDDRLREREKVLLKNAESQKELLTRSIGITTAPKKPVNSSLSQYGLREYQNSQLPPKKVNSAFTGIQQQQRPAVKEKAAAQSTQKTLRQPVATRINKQAQQQAKENFDGTKFLETMASIYQKSGRDDLATGIRQNLLRK